MRHDELRALIHKFFKKALSAQVERLSASGPMSELELAPFKTSRGLAEGADEDFWDILQPDGTEAFLSQFCEDSGIPQSEARENPNRVLREYKNAFRDMLRALEKQRLSLDTYDYAALASSGPQGVEPTTETTSSLTLQQAIDEYIYENKRAGTSRTEPPRFYRRPLSSSQATLSSMFMFA